MALDPATISKVIAIGIQIYEFIDKVTNKGEHGDPLKPIVQRLNDIRTDIANLGQDFQRVIGEEIDTVLDEFRITQLAKLPAAQAAVADYLRTHQNPDLNLPPDRGDANYAQARGLTLEVKSYFERDQLEYMGGFFQAMNARVEFMTAPHLCWWKHNPEYIDELRRAVTHANGKISYVKAGINRQYRVSERVNTHIEHEEPQEPPFDKPRPIKVVDSYTFSVNAGGQVLWSKTVPPAQRTTGRNAAEAARTSFAVAKQNEVMGNYDKTVAAWNGLLQQGAAASIQRALLPHSAAAPLAISRDALEITALRAIEPAQDLQRMSNGHAEGEAVSEMPVPRYELPLRDLLVKVLHSAEFQQRQQRSLQSSNGRLVNFWFDKAFQREPSSEEAQMLAGVIKLFGPKAFFSCLAYSREYEERWGAGLPLPQQNTELVTQEL